jgi:hypothetical protein
MATSILRIGSRGPTVTDVQNLLNQRLRPSPNLTPDGIYGPKTRQAVISMQRNNWLVVDGEVGPCTWAVLRQTESTNILHRVMLVPQIDPTACWLAATSMLLRQSIPRSSVPQALLLPNGSLRNDSDLINPINTQAYAQHFNLKLYYPQSWSATGLANVIRRGPVATHILWNLSGYAPGVGSSGHFAVIAGIRGDDTAAGTTLRIYDPWPPGQGTIRSFGYHKLMNNVPGLTYQLFQKK